MDFAHAAFQCAFGGFQFQNHATGDDTRLHEAFDLLAGDRGDYILAVKDAGNVRQVDKMVSADEFRTGGGHVIGIDVVEFAVGTLAKTSRYRQQIFAPEGFEKGNLDTGKITDETKAAFDIVMDQGSGGEAGGVRGGNSDCGLARCGDGGCQALVQKAAKDQHSGVAGFAVGNAQASDKLTFDAEALQCGGEKTAAAMDDKNFVAMASEVGDVLRERSSRGCVFKQSSGKFDNNPHSSPVCSWMPSIRLRF